ARTTRKASRQMARGWLGAACEMVAVSPSSLRRPVADDEVAGGMPNPGVERNERRRGRETAFGYRLFLIIREEPAQGLGSRIIYAAVIHVRGCRKKTDFLCAYCPYF